MSTFSFFVAIAIVAASLRTYIHGVLIYITIKHNLMLIVLRHLGCRQSLFIALQDSLQPFHRIPFYLYPQPRCPISSTSIKLPLSLQFLELSNLVSQVYYYHCTAYQKMLGIVLVLDALTVLLLFLYHQHVTLF